MTAEEYRIANDKRFADWETKVRTTIHVAVDGAVDPEKYYQSKPRILFVLKEMHASPWERQSLTQYLGEDRIHGKTWNNIVRWRSAICQVMSNDTRIEVAPYKEPINDLDRKQALADVAVINMKKVPGGSSGCMPTIIQHAKHFRQELSDQIAMLDPDVIVACGVFLRDVSGFEELKEDPAKKAKTFLIHTFRSRPRIIIYTDHSQAYKATNEMLDKVKNACSGAKMALAEMSA